MKLILRNNKMAEKYLNSKYSGVSYNKPVSQQALLIIKIGMLQKMNIYKCI